MSSNDSNPERAAKRHVPAIVGIGLALVVALLAFLIFMPGVDEDDEGIATTAPPEGVTSTEAEGGMAEGGSN